MRELTLAELELISGGSSTTEVDGIVVVADGGGGGDWGDWGDWGDGGDWGDQGDSIDGGGGGDAGPPAELPICVSHSPANIDEDMLMSVIQHLTNEFRGVYNNVPGNVPIDSSQNEYGVLIYEINGQIGYGNIVTNNSPNYVDITNGNVPDGARIIGYMHNHPDQNGIDDRVPSSHAGGDWDRYQNLVNQQSLSRGITVDPNLLLVLYTNEDDKTRVYDKDDKNTNTASCAV